MYRLITLRGFMKPVTGTLLLLTVLPFWGRAHAAGTATPLECSVNRTASILACDYRYSLKVPVKNVALHIGGSALQIPGPIGEYPAAGQSTAVLVLVDTSDPKRKSTVETKSQSAVRELIRRRKARYQKLGIAGFDTDLHVLAPIGASDDNLNNAVTQLNATGQATEFYKSVLAAIAELRKVDASRKALIVLSDGKDEDHAYHREDVVQAAHEAGVSILTLGYLEKPTDSPFLQTLKRLSEETDGLFFDATNDVLPTALQLNPFEFVEKGGHFTVPVPHSFWGKRSVTVTLGVREGKPVELSTQVDFPDLRTRTEIARNYVNEHLWPLIGGAIGLVFIIVLTVLVLKRRKASLEAVVEYAYLREMDGSGTCHVMKKTAISIGRSSANDIQLINDSVSSHHAEIHRRREGGFYIVDLASSNGVYVNDSRVNQTELSDGDLVELGEVRLRFSRTSP